MAAQAAPVDEQRMQHADRTIYLDISDLLANAKFQSRVAGIQRVTLRLIAQLLARRPETRISLIGFHPELKQLVEVDSDWCNEHLDHDHLQFIRVFDLELQTPLPIPAALSKRSGSAPCPFPKDIDAHRAAERKIFRETPYAAPIRQERQLRSAAEAG